MTFYEWRNDMLRTFDGRTERFGQHYFNCLPIHVANKIVATSYDPFYADAVTPEIEARVMELWESLDALTTKE